MTTWFNDCSLPRYLSTNHLIHRNLLSTKEYDYVCGSPKEKMHRKQRKTKFTRPLMTSTFVLCFLTLQKTKQNKESSPFTSRRKLFFYRPPCVLGQQMSRNRAGRIRKSPHSTAARRIRNGDLGSIPRIPFDKDRRCSAINISHLDGCVPRLCHSEGPQAVCFRLLCPLLSSVSRRHIRSFVGKSHIFRAFSLQDCVIFLWSHQKSTVF